MGGRLGNERIHKEQAIKELNETSTALLALTDFGKIKYDGKVYKAIYDLAKERNEKIDIIFKEEIAKRDEQTQQYLEEVAKRKGEMAAFVPTTHHGPQLSILYQGPRRELVKQQTTQQTM